MGLTEAQVVALRRKLEALGYSDGLDAASAQLVQKLTDDLVHTTDSYRTLKLQCARQAQELSVQNDKVRVPNACACTTLALRHKYYAHCSYLTVA
jgi:hypothetical protein